MKSSKNKETDQTPAQFAKDHWKEIFAVSSTLAGAVILLLIRYYKKHQEDEGNPDLNTDLDVLAEEATSDLPQTPMLVEVGRAATKKYSWI
jgi:hypothetical protein